MYKRNYAKNMETNMTTGKALDILERHNLWRRGADYVEATDPRLLGMALDKAIEVLRLSNVVGRNEQLKCDCCNGTGIVEGEHYDDLQSCNTCLGKGTF